MTVSLPISSKPHKGVAVLGPDYPQTQFIHEPLNCRAWTLQEGLLSWRAVSYGTDALSWNCQAQFMKTGPPDHQQDQISESLQSDHGISYDAVGWQQLIWDYSKRRITYPADKLAALSGIARLFHSRINVQYIAGFWEHTLPEALLWRCGTMCPDELTGDPPSNVPSWSWLAVSVGVVYFEDTRGPNKTRVVNWSIRPVGPDPFGQLESWSITLRGPIKHATLLSPETALGGSLLRDGWGSDGRRRYTRRGDTRDDSFGDVTTDFDIRNFSNLLQLPRLSGPSRNVACLLFKKGEHGSGIGRLLAGFDWNHKLHRSYRRVGLFDIERISWFDDAKIETITVV
jgi:hypothetical protein